MRRASFLLPAMIFTLASSSGVQAAQRPIGARPDTQAPTVSLRSSAVTVTKPGSITLTAIARDNRAVSKVEFYEGSKLIGRDTLSPFNASIAFTSQQNGTHTYLAKAYDAAGNVGTSGAMTVNVNISNSDADIKPPMAVLSTSASSFTSDGSLILTATASDNIGVAKVELMEGSTLLASLSTPPYTKTIPVTSSMNGAHSYSAKAYDAAGNMGVSSVLTVSVNIPVNSDNQVPLASLTSSASSFTAEGSLVLTASASDNVGVTKVDLLDGNTLLASFSAPPYAKTLSVNGGMNGTHSYTAKAYDAAGNIGYSAAVKVSVAINDGTPSGTEPSFMEYSDNGKKALAINSNGEYLGPDGQPFGVITNGTLRSFKAVSDLISRDHYKALFPTLHGVAIDYGTWQDTQVSLGKDIFTYDNLIKAASYYPDFANHGTRHDRLRELAACLSNYSHETTGGWGAFTMGSNRYKYGLYFMEEVSNGQSCDVANCADYCVADETWGYACNITPQPFGDGRSVKPKYHGRGPIQLSYNFNYGLMSQQLEIAGPSGKMDGLLYQPWLITRNGVLAFRSGFWFWMTPQAPKPSCHDVMTQRWKPNAADTAANRVAGLGLTVNIINGGAECDQALKDQVRDRIGYYLTILSLLGGTNGDGTLKVSPKAGGSVADGSYSAGDPANPTAEYCLDCVNMRRY